MTERATACPNCGSEVVFRWSGAVQTTCAACRSILVRHDLDLTMVGEVGDVPPSTSRIQLGTTGRFDGKPFEVIGRIIYHYERGHWSEWHIRIAGSDSAWLSDALGDYVVTTLVATPADAPDVVSLQPGRALTVGTTKFLVSSVTRAHYAGVEGELPFEYWDKSECLFADLVTQGGDDVGTIDYSESPPLLFVGRAVEFEALQLSYLREETLEQDESIRVAGLNCPSCGAAIELRTGALAQVVACRTCGSLLDAKDPNLAVLQQAGARQRRQQRPLIPLGSTGKLKGQKWTAIGFQVRSIFVEQVEYAWREYLLWNADLGYRYLTEYDGHWNEISTLKGAPTQVSAGDQPVMEYRGTRFKHFQSADAITQLVLGEFPWQVRTGDSTRGEDYVAPPLMLSKEMAPGEVTWSLGTYTEPERIREAFKVKEEFPPRIGVFANQPNPRRPASAYWGGFSLLVIACLGMIVLRWATAANKEVFASTYEYNRLRGDTTAFVTPEFDVAGGASNLAVDIKTNLDNNWAFFNLALIGADGTAYDFAREVSYYHGVEGGEAWTEGSRTDRVTLPAIPPGRYYLRVEPEREDYGAPFSYSIKARRDVPRVWPYFVALLLLLIPPVALTFSRASFEAKRWSESDHAPTAANDDE